MEDSLCRKVEKYGGGVWFGGYWLVQRQTHQQVSGEAELRLMSLSLSRTLNFNKGTYLTQFYLLDICFSSSTILIGNGSLY